MNILSILLISLNDVNVVFSIFLLLVLLIFSALISGSEVAFFSLNQTQLESESKTFKKRDLVAKLLSNPKGLLATILVANNFINIAIVLLFASISNVFFTDISQELQFVIEVIIVTFLILLFGEILPKVYASRNNEKFSSFMAKPIDFLQKLLKIFSYPMQAGTNFLEKKLSKSKSEISISKLSQALELASEEATTDEEKNILRGIVSFGNTDTKQVMRSRVDIFALDTDSSFTQIIKEIIKEGYSRIPVYTESLDNISGVLYVKDLLPYLDNKNVKWQNLIREPFFVPENKKLDDLLTEFKTKKIHMAIVVDEYGGTSGIITLEDVIEETVIIKPLVI